MKIRLLLALVGLAIGFALPTFAQQTNTPGSDPQIIEQLDALGKKFSEAWNNNDAAALAAFYTEDAVRVNDTGPIYGRDAIQKLYADLFKQVHISNHFNKRDQYHAIGTAGNEVWANGEWSSTAQGKDWGPIDNKGYWSVILVRDGDTWKFLMETWNITPAPAPAATPSTTTTPSNK
jgi:ketosteroid isomerase-like protein